MRSSLSIVVNAPGRRIFELARDLESWPQLLPHYKRVTIESRVGERVRARMVALRSFGAVALPVSWAVEQWADDSESSNLRLQFRHVRGVTRGMRVTWHIEDSGDAATRVTIEHDFDRALPLLGSQLLPRFVNRYFIRHIAGRTLATFKALAESGA